jgi:hypothetical protein
MATGRERNRSSAPKRSSVRVYAVATTYWNPTMPSPGAAVAMTVRATGVEDSEPAKA